ncbi:hypothetical protein CSPB12327_06985 [Campylobacter sp. RM12327]|uniref:hypothetical protein n=1 Tax=Campylobacter sputorum TaxID=206 RepID=UPI000B77B811|nr:MULTISPECIES: hypothetical protein [Campylobacter]ASM40161.1 hypothetical protein CSPB_0948 [Campylobacter sputorum]MBE7358540.1 hypothetical protein [Campylobacter sp. RM11302]MBF6669882.1 hypothetical protein [Campylobacter sp. RM12327]MBF6675138.1 hypothetical protein [Campylobacter sp. RM13538]MBF6676440.1 hypothetical protein [Campylobacter sp. RM12321]
MKKYLTINEAYIYSYKFLSDLYFQNLDDDLGGFLGGMSPEIWIGENAGDEDLYNQWIISASKISNSTKLTLKESFLIMIKFLNIQYELFDEVWAKNLVNEIVNNKKYFKKWIKFEV